MQDREPSRGEAPSPARHRVEVLRVKPGEHIDLIALSNSIRGVVTHFHQKKSRYCPGQDECPFHRLLAEFKGYIAALVFDVSEKSWKPWCVEVPAFAEVEMRDVYGRGQAWRFERAAHPKKANPTIPTLTGQVDAAGLLPTFEVVPILRRFYAAPGLVMDARNPLPPMVYAGQLPQHAVKLIESLLAGEDQEQEAAQEQEERVTMQERFAAQKRRTGQKK